MVSASTGAEEPLARQPQTEAYLGGRSLGKGTLCISPSMLTWKEDSKQIGFSLLYPNISLHAIRREPIPSLYMMIDYKLELPDGLALPEEPRPERDSDEEADSDDEENCLTELMFAPDDQDVLQKLFDAMSECQVMHPDPNDSFSDEDEDIYEDASDIMDDNESINQQQAQNPVEEHMEGLNLETSNNHQTNNGADDMDCDPEEFADA